jgi:hypothetical protein
VRHFRFAVLVLGMIVVQAVAVFLVFSSGWPLFAVAGSAAAVAIAIGLAASVASGWAARVRRNGQDGLIYLLFLVVFSALTIIEAVFIAAPPFGKAGTYHSAGARWPVCLGIQAAVVVIVAAIFISDAYTNKPLLSAALEVLAKWRFRQPLGWGMGASAQPRR